MITLLLLALLAVLLVAYVVSRLVLRVAERAWDEGMRYGLGVEVFDEDFACNPYRAFREVGGRG